MVALSHVCGLDEMLNELTYSLFYNCLLRAQGAGTGGEIFTGNGLFAKTSRIFSPCVE